MDRVDSQQALLNQGVRINSYQLMIAVLQHNAAALAQPLEMQASLFPFPDVQTGPNPVHAVDK